MLSDHDPVEKVTLIPRGNRTGLTWFTAEEDQGLISRGQILARIIGTLGARAAEEIIFGEAEVTTGAQADIMQVTSMARQMVTRYGMSPVGPIAFEDETNNQVFLDGTMAGGSSISFGIPQIAVNTTIDTDNTRIISTTRQLTDQKWLFNQSIQSAKRKDFDSDSGVNVLDAGIIIKIRTHHVQGVLSNSRIISRI